MATSRECELSLALSSINFNMTELLFGGVKRWGCAEEGAEGIGLFIASLFGEFRLIYDCEVL